MYPTLTKRDIDILLKRPFVIYNQKTNDSYIILNINKEKKYLFYYDNFNKERTIRFFNEASGIDDKRFIY